MPDTRTIVKWVLCASLVVTQTGVAHGQRRTIPEIVAGGAATDGVLGRVRTVGSGPTPEVTDVLRTTDVIVRGIVDQPRGYLSDDQFDVYNDYPIVNPAILFAFDI